MRRNRQTTQTYSHPEGPQQAVETIVTHLSKVFGGERSSDTSVQFLDIEVDNNPFPAEDIQYIINKMAPRKAPGDDHITGAMLKPLAKPLSHTPQQFFYAMLKLVVDPYFLAYSSSCTNLQEKQSDCCWQLPTNQLNQCLT